jgi:hypothetical protein
MCRARVVALAALAAACPAALWAQSDAPVGVRAAGMGGAFVAVADDASAVFWNPAGLATGSYFSLVLDQNTVGTDDEAPLPRSRSGWLTAIGTPPLGISYYRTRTTRITPLSPGIPESIRASSLVTHQTGVTLVQSLVPSVSVGATLKFVRGVAASAIVPFDATLDDAEGLIGRASNKFDLDVGVMASSGPLKVGLAVRNVLEPEFDVAGSGDEIPLERRVRAGVSFRPAPAVTLAADADLTRADVSTGAWRDAAVGAEFHPVLRAWLRTGVHWNTAREGMSAAPIGSVGVSFAVSRYILIDGQYSGGSRVGDSGWGAGARVVF